MPEGITIMKKSVGFNKEEVIDLAKKHLPSFIDVEVEEHEDSFVFILRWKPDIWVKHGIHKTGYPDNTKNETDLLRRIRARTEKEVLETIRDFGVDRIEELKSSFGLEDFYKEKYRDKNVVYKVKKMLEIRPNFSTNLEAYYYANASAIMPSFKPLWEAMVLETAKHDNAQEIVDYLHGALERTKQLIYARDRMRDIIAENPPDNDIEFTINFYIFHFISLVKSLGDNLAWIAKLYCKIPLDEKKTDLAFESFENYLMAENKRLFHCIYDNPNFGDFRRIKTFRDVIHHKHALHVQTVELGFNGPKKVMIAVDPKSGLIIDGKRYMEKLAPKRAEASDKKSIAEYGLKTLVVWIGRADEMPWEDPLVFCQKFIVLMGQLCNSTFERILVELGRKPLGKVTDYLPKIGVVIMTVTDEIHTNDRLLIEGTTTSFIQNALSIEIDNTKVGMAKEDQTIGLKVNEKARKGDSVFKLPPT